MSTAAYRFGEKMALCMAVRKTTVTKIPPINPSSATARPKPSQAPHDNESPSVTDMAKSKR